MRGDEEIGQGRGKERREEKKVKEKRNVEDRWRTVEKRNEGETETRKAKRAGQNRSKTERIRERCPPRQNSRSKRRKAKVEPLSTEVSVE